MDEVLAIFEIAYTVFLPPPPSKSSPQLSTKAFLKDLPEMKPVDREGNGLRKKAGTADRNGLHHLSRNLPGNGAG